MAHFMTGALTPAQNFHVSLLLQPQALPTQGPSDFGKDGQCEW